MILGLRVMLLRLKERFQAMYSRRAYVHYYAEGMDEMAFEEAESDLLDLISGMEMYDDAQSAWWTPHVLCLNVNNVFISISDGKDSEKLCQS